MDLLIILTYVAIAWSIFKIFKIPVNKWTVPTAALGGVFIVSALILLMNYNHPYTFLAQKAVISIPITPQVTGVVDSVTDKANQRVKKGEVLFTIDPARYQARVDRLQADQRGLDLGRLGKELQRHCGDNAERTFCADEQLLQIVAAVVLAQGPETVPDPAVR